MPELWPQWIAAGDSFESADPTEYSVCGLCGDEIADYECAEFLAPPGTTVYNEDGNSRITEETESVYVHGSCGHEWGLEQT